jgi:hypothetical protein
MLIERDCALVEFGSVPSATGGPIPEVRVDADEDARGRAQPEEPTGGQNYGSSTVGSRAARVGQAVVAYVIAGVIGWFLYDFVSPARIAWPDISSFFTPRSNAESAEMSRQMIKLSEDLHVLRTRIDVLEAHEKARAQEMKSLQSVDDTNRRINEVRAGVDAQIGALSNQLKEIKHEAETKALEPRQAVSDQPERRAGDGAEIGRKAASVAAHVEPEWRRTRHRRHDAFDPANDPTAPGAPRPLGGGLSR